MLNGNTQVTRGSQAGTGDWSATNEIEKFYETVRGRRNILHDYNLYNYNFTLVSLSKDQLENPSSYKGKVFTNDQESTDFFIVCRSGGFKRNNTFSGGLNQTLVTDSDTGNNAKDPEFRDKDLYIENVRFETRVGINNIGSSNLTKGTFNIIEPYSSTGFYQTLFNASVFAGHPSYIGAPFLLVLSFYGRQIGKNDGEPEIVPQATRYIPVLITKSDMNVTEGGAQYNVEFVGANQQVLSPVYATTRAEINGPSATSTNNSGTERDQTVAIVLNDFFKKHNDASKEFYRQQWRRANNGGSNVISAVAERLESNASQANLAARQQGVEVLTPGEEDNMHKYCIWFASRYDTGGGGGGGGADAGAGPFPSDLSQLTYDDWSGKADQVLTSGLLNVPYSNEIANSEMINGDLPRTGGRTSQDVQEALDAYDEDIREAQSKRREAQGYIRSLRAQIQGKLTAIGEQLELLAPEDTPDDLNSDLLASTGERVEASQLNATFQSFRSTASNLVTGISSRVPQQNLVAVNQLITEANALISDFETHISAEIQAEAELERLNEERSREANRPLNFYNGEIDWAWRQGMNIKTVIETVILESVFSGDLSKPEQLANIRSTEYVDWFRIEVFQKPTGFDPFTMDYRYEFHFIVQPYKIHYSKLPGLNIQFSTRLLKQLAVREYNYIYTGKNVDVLDFALQYNNLFFAPMIFNAPQESQESQTEETGNVAHRNYAPGAYPSTLEELQKQLQVGYGRVQPMLRSQRPTHRRGEPSYPNEVAQAFQDFLYNSPSDQALLRARIKVIGDPVYIIGSGITNRPRLDFNTVVTEDGEMNAFSREVDVVFKFQTIDDIPSQNQLDSQFQSTPIINRYNGVYQVVAVTNFFEEGQFYQELECLRRPNQETDFESPPSQSGDLTQEEADQTTGPGDNPESQGQDGRNDAQPNTEPSGSTTNPLDVVPSVPPNSATGRLIQAISTRTGLSVTEVRQRIGQEVIDNRIATGIDASGRGAEATTSEIVAAAVDEFPSQLPNVPNTPAGIAQVVALFNSPLPTQDQIQQEIGTPGEARNILDLINLVAGGSPNPYSPPGASGTGSIVLNQGARRYWGNVPRDEKVRITDLAGQVDYPLRINSSQRPEDYNEAVGGAERSYHLSGQAFDVSTEGWDYQQTEDFIRRASQAGYNGIDVGSNYIHIDTRSNRWGRLQSGADPRLADTIDQHREAPLRPLNLPGNGN